MQCVCIPTNLHLCKPVIETNMSNQVNPALAKYANLMIEKMKEADTIVIGSPLYWHNICGSVRNVLDRFYGKVNESELLGRKLYFVFQGAAPEKWMLDAGEYTMKRFASLYGMKYMGMATNAKEAEDLNKTV